MTRIPKVPVGQTPVSRYGSWAEHRREIHRDAMRQLRKKAAARSSEGPVEKAV